MDVDAEKHVLLQMNNSESKVHKVFMPTVVEDPPEICPLKDARCFAALQTLCSKNFLAQALSRNGIFMQIRLASLRGPSQDLRSVSEGIYILLI